MALIELALMLELRAASSPPDVRAWIDLWPELGLDSEIELPLTRHDPQRWMGLFTVGDGLPDYFLYRIGVVAHSGGAWSLTVRRRGRGCVLLRDEDELALPKLWLAGTCHLPD
jgi:hypothetical protein